ncbi:MAG: RNA methyltransferase [Bacteroidetes bacterium]|nr:RNA methyltransferase [Bacteroidota bacterium]
MLSKNQIKEIQALHLKKNRALKKLFIAEGVKTVQELINTVPHLVNTVFGMKDFIETHKILFQKLNINYVEVSKEELEKISLQSSPNGVLATCGYFEETETAFDFNNNFAFYLDDVRDPGNFGTLVRLSSWFGINTVFCSPSSCDIYNPKVIQAAMGAFLRVKVVYTELENLIKEQNIKTVYGALLNGKNLYRETLQNGLIIIGNEANGIREENFKFITQPITIPAHAQNSTESLNAAMAGSVIASEFFRQLKQ